MNQSLQSFKHFVLTNLKIYLLIIGITIAGAFLITMAAKDEQAWVAVFSVIYIYSLGMFGLVVVNIVLTCWDYFKGNHRRSINRLLSTGVVFILGLVVAVIVLKTVR